MSAQDRVLQAILPDVEAAIQSFWEGEYGRKCESEIERIFAATAFVGQQVVAAKNIAPSRASSGKGIFIEPQYVIGPYRVDFLMGFLNKDKAADLLECIVVECDGHDFHERTKQQAAKDKARDRYLSSQVGRVVRFTGRELFRDPQGCLVEAIKIAGIVNGVRFE